MSTTDADRWVGSLIAVIVTAIIVFYMTPGGREGVVQCDGPDGVADGLLEDCKTLGG